MTQDLLIGIVALIAAASLFIVGKPTRHGEPVTGRWDS
jgi:hypothetical protein